MICLFSQRIRREKGEPAAENFSTRVHIVTWHKQLILVMVCLMFGLQVKSVHSVHKVYRDLNRHYYLCSGTN